MQLLVPDVRLYAYIGRDGGLKKRVVNILPQIVVGSKAVGFIMELTEAI